MALKIARLSLPRTISQLSILCGVILTRLTCEFEIGTQKRAARLGDEFFAGIAFIAPALAAKAASQAITQKVYRRKAERVKPLR